MKFHLSMKSSNAKTGPIPVSTSSRETCPTDCSMRDECYAGTGPLALHWSAVTNGARGVDFTEFCDAIASLPDRQLWRHNQAGDLPGDGVTVDPVRLGMLVRSNEAKRGFTYSHYRDSESLRWIRHANDFGFTVNLSGNNPADADMLADTGAGPVVTVLPSDCAQKGLKLETPAGRRILVCPATTHDNVSCATCGLCAKSDRDFIIGFPAHGSGAKRADAKIIPIMRGA